MTIQKIKPLKIFGQNFLKDKNIANKIVDLLGEIENEEIIEIGPGMGALTELILQKNAKITAFDVDERAIKYLTEKFNKNIKIRIIHSDIRKIQLENYTKNKISLIGNIPYNITNDIIFWLFDNAKFLNKAILTIQKEVAERLVAKPKTKDYGITTLAMQLYANAKIAFHIPASAFFPAPKVTSSVIIIDFQVNKFIKYFNQDEEIDKKELMKFIRAAFSQRRKMLNNSLKSYLNSRNIDLEKLTKTLESKEKKYLKMRAEELSVEDYIHFFEIIK